MNKLTKQNVLANLVPKTFNINLFIKKKKLKYICLYVA